MASLKSSYPVALLTSQPYHRDGVRAHKEGCHFQNQTGSWALTEHGLRVSVPDVTTGSSQPTALLSGSITTLCIRKASVSDNVNSICCLTMEQRHGNAMDWTVRWHYPGTLTKVLWSWHNDRQISHWRWNKEPRHRPSLMWPLDFWQRYHYNSAWTGWSSQQMVLEKLESHIESYEPQPLPDSIHKKEFKMNPRPQCKKLNDKTSSRNIRDYLQGLGWTKVVWGHRKQ